MKDKSSYFLKERYFILVIVLVSFACSFYFENYYILIINLLIGFFIKFRPFEWKQLIFILCFIGVVFLFCWFVDESFKTKNFIELINNNIPFSPKKLLFNFFDQKYTNQNTNEFLKLLIFNHKTNLVLLTNIYNINIAHLFIVSGLHLNIFIVIFNKIFKVDKLKKFRITIILIFLIVYGYFLNFNVGFLRVFITYLLSLKKNKLTKNDATSISALIIALLGFYNVIEFAFIISYLCIYTIIFINSFKNESSLFKNMLIIIMIGLFSFPFSFYFNSKINILGVIFSYVFGLPVIALYQFVFWFMLIPKFEVVLDFLVHKIEFIISNINKINAFIYISENMKKYFWIYFLLYSTTFFWFYKQKIVTFYEKNAI